MGEARKIDKKIRYTYDDYKNWNDDDDCEIINGVGYEIDRHPTVRHQRISGKLTFAIGEYLEGKSSKVFFTLDVVFSREDVVRPDLVVICDKNKITEKNIQGAPDLVIEILSPSTSKRDRKTKLELYRKFGVKEYWIVDPLYYQITVHNFSNNEIVEYMLDEEEPEVESIVPVGIFGNELKLDLKYIFSE